MKPDLDDQPFPFAAENALDAQAAEDRITGRIPTLRRSEAATRFIQAMRDRGRYPPDAGRHEHMAIAGQRPPRIE